MQCGRGTQFELGHDWIWVVFIVFGLMALAMTVNAKEHIIDESLRFVKSSWSIVHLGD